MTYATKLDAALDHAREGYAVFPLRAYDHPTPATPEALEEAAKEAKKPAVKNWQSLATTDETQIKAWWHQWPEANIGIPTGGMIVVDVDPRNGGDKTFTDLMLTDGFPKTVNTRTQGGGAHILYALPPHVSLSGGKDKLGKGIDIRAHGNFIVAPGSTIADRSYEWSKGHVPGKKMTLAPQWIIDKCKAPKEKTAAAGKRLVEEDSDATNMAWDYVMDHAPKAELGELKDMAYKVACRIFDYGVTEATATEMLRWYGDMYCTPRLEDETITHTIRSAQAYRGNAIGSRHPDAHAFEAVEIAPRQPIKAALLGTASRFQFISYRDAARIAIEQASEPLIEGILDVGAMSIWYGDSNTGKTFVLVDAGWHVAAGREWAGMPVKQGAVAYIFSEGGHGALKRVKALQDRYPDAGDVPFYALTCAIDLRHKDVDLRSLIADLLALEKRIGQKLELVCIDTLSRAMAGGNENDSQDMGSLVTNLDTLRAAIAAHLATVHHTGKDKAKGARGHSILRAATDTEIEIDGGRLTVTKQRDMDGNLELGFSLVPCTVGVTPKGKPITTCTVDMRRKGVASDEPIALDPQHLALYDALEDATKRGEPFDAEFAGTVARTIRGLSFRRSKVFSMLSTIVQSGWMKKPQHGQYVIHSPRKSTTIHELVS